MEEKNSEKDIKSSFLTFLGEGISLSGVEERSEDFSSISKSSSFIMNKVLSDDLVKVLIFSKDGLFLSLNELASADLRTIHFLELLETGFEFIKYFLYFLIVDII
jgi:hypothetical protein